MSSRPCRITPFLTALLLLASHRGLFADDPGDASRQIFEKHRRSVVTIQIVIKMKMSFAGMPAQANESKSETTGTVIDASGLTVLSLSSCEPDSMFENLMGGVQGFGGEDMKMKMTTEITDLKILLDDSTELPAAIVLRDKDLDLAFVRPKEKPSKPLTALDLAKSSRAAVFDQVVAINRLGLAAGRSYSGTLERIAAVVEKPRSFYIPAGGLGAATMGSPAFTLDGNILGVFVMRSVKASGNSSVFTMNFQPDNIAAIILPVAEIQKVAVQAPEYKPEGKAQ